MYASGALTPVNLAEEIPSSPSPDHAWIHRLNLNQLLAYARQLRVEDQPEALHPVTRQIIEGGRSPSAAAAFRAIHRLAELRRETETAPGYRLYTLPGGLLERPGLIHDPAAESQIALLVWSVGSASFGGFVAGIPARSGSASCAGPMEGWFADFCAKGGLWQRLGRLPVSGGWRAYLQTS